MNIYENIVILDTSLTDEEVESALTKIKELVVGQGGEVLKVDIWGRKKLAYDIKKQKKGVYVILFYKIPPAAIKKIEEFYKVFDAVLKFIIIKLSAKQVLDLEKIKAISEPAEQKGEA